MTIRASRFGFLRGRDGEEFQTELGDAGDDGSSPAGGGDCVRRLDKSDIRTVLGLRASGTANDEIAKGVVDKVFQNRKLRKLQTVIGKYANERVKEMMPMITPQTLLEERVGKAANTQKALSEAIHKYQAEHPGCSRQDAIDKVLFGPGVREIVRLENQIDEVVKAKNTLPQHRATTDIDFSNPLRGTPGYNPSKDGRPPGTAHATGGPQSGADVNPIIRDHHELLADIASGKVNETDPKFQALRALELKRLYGKD